MHHGVNDSIYNVSSFDKYFQAWAPYDYTAIAGGHTNELRARTLGFVNITFLVMDGTDTCGLTCCSSYESSY